MVAHVMPIGTPYEVPAGAIAAILGARRYDGPTRAKFNAVTVGTTTTRVLDNNPRRVAWMMVNISVNQGFANFDNSVSSSNGIILGAGGGSVSVEVDEDGETPAWEVFGVCTGAAGVWWVYEVVRM
jgi:hypothetical protein